MSNSDDAIIQAFKLGMAMSGNMQPKEEPKAPAEPEQPQHHYPIVTDNGSQSMPASRRTEIPSFI